VYRHRIADVRVRGTLQTRPLNRLGEAPGARCARAKPAESDWGTGPETPRSGAGSLDGSGNMLSPSGCAVKGFCLRRTFSKRVTCLVLSYTRLVLGERSPLGRAAALLARCPPHTASNLDLLCGADRHVRFVTFYLIYQDVLFFNRGVKNKGALASSRCQRRFITFLGVSR
jgi:hypothetical protein